MRRPSPRLVSVVVPVRNAATTLGEQLEALASQSYAGPWEVVVADNGSTDDTRAVARSWQGRIPELRVVNESSRRGAAAAMSAGLSASRGDFVAACDGDDRVSEAWLERLVEAAADFDLVGGPFDSGLLNDPVTRAWRGDPPGDRLPIGMHFLPAARGANIGIWREVLESVGGWDASMPIGSDWELCFRAQVAGYRLGFAPGAMVHYRYRPSVWALMRQRFAYGKWQPLLYGRFRDAGMPPSEAARAFRAWGALLQSSPSLFGSRARRGAWLGRLAFRAGRIAGSVKFRSRYL